MVHRFKVQKRAPHRIEISVHKIQQLFNSMDASPFHEKDLDHDAEEFIVSWAQEFPRHEPVSLLVPVDQIPAHGDAQALVETAIHNYFATAPRLTGWSFAISSPREGLRWSSAWFFSALVC